MEGATPGKKQPCPCGSGKKYKHCCALTEFQRQESWREWKRNWQWARWVLVAALVGFGFSRLGPKKDSALYRTTRGGFQERIRYYAASELSEVDFSKLNDQQKKNVMDKANKTRCTCGCNMTLAQ